MATKTLTQVTLLIDRDANTKIPVVVFDYEQPLIEEIYGEELVHEFDSKDVQVQNFDVHAAFDGLVSKYGANAKSDRARKLLYPKLRDLEKRLGFTAAQAKAGSGADADSGPLTEGTVTEIVAKLPKLSDEELDQLEQDEQAGKQRAGLMSAIEAERKKREAAQ